MSSTDPRPVDSFDRLVGGSDSGAALDEALAAAESIDASDVLAVCRIRCAQILGHRSSLADAPDVEVARIAAWPETSSGVERAALAFTEQYLVDVASVTPELTQPLVDELGPATTTDFVNALLVVEQRMRLELAWERLGL